MVSIMKVQLLGEKNPNLRLFLANTFFLLLLIFSAVSFYYNPQTNFAPWKWSRRGGLIPCDLFRGDWVPDPDGPYYTNETCNTIHEQQNCIKYGRPDLEFTKWRWKPEGCELPRFDPVQFFELTRGKSMAFVGDSVARNHMQSLLCLLSRVARPVEVSKSKIFFYPMYNLKVANMWSTFLVESKSTGMERGFDGAVQLHVDKPDPKWTREIERYDYVIFSAGQWFYRPSFYYEKNKLVGCYRCLNGSVPKLDLSYGYRRAFRASLAHLAGLPNYGGTTFVRTYSPSHYEGGKWNDGGDCERKEPRRSNETRVEGFDLELRKVQMEELEAAAAAAAEERKGLRYHLLDVTAAMVLRPDGHPSRYGHLRSEAVKIKDCVHWCLPGPVDAWSDLFLELLRRDRAIESSHLH